ncbi:WG repeat-containing protein [Portibacter marinus]|uniref:WG repeat-containing protein n=1 Tax=Portibacter marinus TaxID=2898660 RepID=UPI001F43377A|nr:WG repeat-containing protein [Portibacter marinus]
MMKNASNPENLLAAVRIGPSAFFINVEGSKQSIGEFRFTDNFSSGWACTNMGGERIQNPEGVIGGNFRYVNVAGDVLPVWMEKPSFFSCGLSVIQSGNDYSVIDVNGSLKIQSFDHIFPFNDHLAAAKKKGNLGYLNTNGEWEFLMKPNDVLHSFSGGIAKIIREKHIGFINQTGQWLIEPQKKEIFDFHERFAVVRSDEKFGFINDVGDVIVQPIFQDMGNFSEGQCAFKEKGLWGFLDSTGMVTIAPRFQQVRAFKEGKAAFQLEGKVGFINQEGEVVIPPTFEAAFEFKNELCIAQQNRKLGYIDASGEWVLSPKYDRANHFVHPEDDNPYFRPN